MEEFDTLINADQAEILASLDGFQVEIIESFLHQTNNNYLESADKWLNATTANTAQFGGETGKAKIYREKLLDEIEKFFCGDESYDDDRKKISESAEKTKQYIIGVLSSAIGATMGVAGTFIAPVIALLIMSMGKMGVNAWCAMRIEIKANQQT